VVGGTWRAAASVFANTDEKRNKVAIQSDLFDLGATISAEYLSLLSRIDNKACRNAIDLQFQLV
jgi:hypothetical protein